MSTIFSGLITSKMRIRILMRLFLNPERDAYLRELADEFNASPSHIKEELSNLTETGLLIRKKEGRQVLFSANHCHPIFNELHSMVKKALGMDRILDSIIQRLGNLERAFLVDDYAEGKDSGIIDLVLIGNIDKENLLDLAEKTEKYIDRKIRTLSLSCEEYRNNPSLFKNRPQFLLWQVSGNNSEVTTNVADDLNTNHRSISDHTVLRDRMIERELKSMKHKIR